MTATGAPEGRWCDLPRHYSERISKIGQGICAKMKTEIKSGCIKSSFTSASEDDIGPPMGPPRKGGAPSHAQVHIHHFGGGIPHSGQTTPQYRTGFKPGLKNLESEPGL